MSGDSHSPGPKVSDPGLRALEDPMDLSKEVARGIARFTRAIEPIVGKTVSVTQPDGSVVTGTLSHETTCQPIVTTATGRRYAVPTDEIARLFTENHTVDGDEWLKMLGDK